LGRLWPPSRKQRRHQAGFGPSRSFRRRSIEAIESIVATHRGRRAAVVTHASVINAYLTMVLGIQRDVFFWPDHASITRLRCTGELYALRSLNETSHLSQAGRGQLL
jgi:probable phosphoglycerate mutase